MLLLVFGFSYMVPRDNLGNLEILSCPGGRGELGPDVSWCFHGTGSPLCQRHDNTLCILVERGDKKGHWKHPEPNRTKILSLTNKLLRWGKWSTKLHPDDPGGAHGLCWRPFTVLLITIRWTTEGPTVLLKLECPSDPVRVSHCQFHVVLSLSRTSRTIPVSYHSSTFFSCFLYKATFLYVQNFPSLIGTSVSITYCSNLFC